MDLRETEAEPHFTRPIRQITTMVVVIVLVAGGVSVAWPILSSIFLSNPWLNGVIAAVFVLGVLSCFRQVWQLWYSVRWIERFASTRGGQNLPQAPSLLAPLATLLRSRGARMQLAASSTRSILDSVAQRIDEDREVTRYLTNLLIFLGLLGTFYGLATTVPALVDTIRSLNPGPEESGTELFGRLQQGLEAQLGGMGTAFSSSLLGLAGSLVVGLLELFAGHGQNRFYRELEEWLSTITRVGFAGEGEGAGEAGAVAQVVDHLSDQLETLQIIFTRNDESRVETDERLAQLAGAMTRLADRLGETDATDALQRVADGQDRLLERMGEAGEGMDAESRMRLRSIDVQMLRLLEELAAGRQESVAELRAELQSLTRAVRQSGRPVREVPNSILRERQG
ncbi:biopolymer transporter ExbB [Wenxinia saemankumensis]|uniref:MotA/TolQ/ExbB proton channel family protein n=1 Tax=Wenxinia saemankumensis TaxID=1447782 RepID=A0A1M6BUI3_9RHOB|nr:biopolymer transporter ExbB [Wenxinia saemankumensis]SHI52158.1 hypothetical protein SAMN05444417_0846 [Wenxinia saemankumensis]